MLWLLVPVGILFLYSVVGFWGVPYYISHFIPQQVSRDYDLNLTFDTVTFNPFTFILDLHSSEVTEAGGKAIAAVPHLELHLAPIQMLRLDFVCTRVDISTPSLHLVRHDDGSYNFDTILPRLRQKHDGSKMMGFADLPFSFSLNNISITEGTVVFDDKPTSKIHNIHQLELQLPTLANIAFQAKSYIRPYFSAIINGSPITLKGSNRKEPSPELSPVTQLSWELKNVALQEYVNYLPFTLPFSLNNGTAAGVLDLKFSNRDDQDDKLAIHFDFSVSDIDIETRQKKLQLASPAMHLSGSFIPVKKLFNVTALQLESPEILVNSQDVVQEISSMFFSDTKKVDDAIPFKKPVIFALYSLQFTKGSLQQQPATKDKEGEEWAGLNLTLNNYVSHESYNLADSKSSLLKISGHKKNGTNVFSYFGGFKSSSTISGELSIKKMEAEKLFSWILPAEKSFKARGNGEMRALLTISKGSDETQLKSSLDNITAKVNNLELSAHSKPVFSAEELTFKGVQPGDKTTALGDITAKKAQLFYTRGNTPAFFSQIESGQYTISKLDYQGDISIGPREKSSPPFVITDAIITYGGGDVSKKEMTNIALSGLTGKDGKVDATGKVSFNPFTIDVSTTFEQLGSVETTALLPLHSFLTKTAGKLSGKGRFTFPQAAFTGNLKVSDGHFTRNSGQTFSWDRFELENINYGSNPYHVAAASIHFSNPQLAFSIQPENNTIPEYCIELARELLTNRAAYPSKQKKSATPFLDIQEISFTDGNINITDQRLSPPWIGRIEAFNGTINNVTSVETAATSSFTFTGSLDGGDLSWSGSIDPIKDNKTDRYNLNLTDYPLKSFSAQLRPVSDINIEAASISLSLSSEWQDGKQYQALQATLSQLRAASPDADSALPLALLSNDKGELQMDFSSLEAPALPNTSLFDNLTGNFQKLTIKGNLSPLLLTKGDFSDLIDNEFIDFKPGQFMLSDKGRTTLIRYEALLITHPNIKLSLSGGVSSGRDKESLYNQLKKDERLRIDTVNEKLFSKWQKNKEEYEAQVSDTQSDTLSKGEISESNIPTKVLSGFRPLLPEPVVVDNEMLFELAEKRLDIVKQHFITQLSLPKERVEIKQQAINELVKNPTARGVNIQILPYN